MTLDREVILNEVKDLGLIQRLLVKALSPDPLPSREGRPL
jgi:hypothetical protein